MTQTDWTRYLLPLPKEFGVRASVRLSPDDISVYPAAQTGPIGAGAAVLGAAIGSGGRRGNAPALTIELACLADHAPDGVDPALDRLPNAAQAYQIFPRGEDRILIVGVEPVGVYYGALTYAQLLSAPRRGERIEVPLVDIIDWPDIEQRGLWNFPDAPSWIPWMASMKLNYGKMADTRLHPVRRGRRNRAAIEATLLADARDLGFEYMPFIVHLNFLHDVGLFRAHPELAGKGDGALAGRYFAHKQGNQHRAPCASQPLLIDILGQWLDSIAQQGATEISCWLSERPCQCQCDRCTPVGQFLLETRAFLAAWERTRVRYHDLQIRIFSSTTTPEQDDQILAELPAGVRFERACASGMERVRHQPRDLFANPLLDRAAADGRWIASYDVPIGAYGNVDTPETKLPQYSAQRIRDYVHQLHGRHYAGAYGMLAWGTQAREVCGFAITALAEYAWNGHGRDVEAFGTAWAQREGWQHPDAVGRWASLLGDVEFDVYDGGFPMAYTWGEMASAVEAGRPPRLGEGLFRHFQDIDDFDRNLAICQQARACLGSSSHALLVLATDVVSSYVDLARSIWRVAHTHAHRDLHEPVPQAELSQQVKELERAGSDNVDAIRAWRRHLGEEPWQHRVHDAIAATHDTVGRISRHMHEQHFDLI